LQRSARSSAFFIATAVLLIASAFLIFVSSERLRTGRELLDHTYEVMLTTRSVFSALQDADSGQRGYLLTGHEDSLALYNQAVARVPALTGRLRALTRDSPGQRRRTDTLTRSIERRLAELRRAIDVFRSAGPEAARSEVANNPGLQTGADIRRTIDEIMAEEGRLLDVRMAAADETESRTLMVALLTMGAALTSLVFAQILLVRRNDQLRRAQATATLKAGLLQATLDHTREGIAAWDAAGRLRAFNARFFEETELPRNLAQEGTPIATVLAHDAARTPQALAFVREGEVRSGEQLMFRGKIGERSVEIGAHPTEDGGFLLSSIDVTRRVQAEQVAAQAHKMEAIGQLTGGIAHDFNNLLQIIRSNLDLLAPRVAADPKAARRVENAISGTERGAQLTRQLLAFARRQPLEPKAVNLGQIVRDMADLLRRTLGERIEIEPVIADGLWNTLADPIQIENAVLNLALNARDAMPEGGKLEIELANAEIDSARAAEHPDLAAGAYVVLTVTDTGTGMTPEVAARVFEPFFTTKADGKGTGLGLAQVYGFVKQSGGFIQISSDVGRGTSVNIYLPRSLRAPERSPLAPRSSAEHGHELILVVEDEADVRAGATDILDGLGYRVIEAGDADAALETLSKNPGVDLLFTDVVMPGSITAVELARRAQELRPEIAVLFTSGYTENALFRDHHLDPGVQLLSKPYRRDDLARKVRAVLDEARAAPDPEDAVRRPDRAPLRVLVAEDDPLVRTTAVALIGELGHHVVEATSAREALDKLDSGIDLLVADIGLPDMSGEELAAECRRRRGALAVIFATGYDTRPVRVAPANSAILLGKPFTAAQLAEAIDGALAQLHLPCS
jgi:signal transduction histidine kinase/DNA-binding response OmpR family regulator